MVDLSVAEPSPGAFYGKEEVECILEEMEKYTCMNELERKNDIRIFEERFAKYIGKKFAISINGGGTALDLILKSLSLSNEDEILAAGINFHGSHLAILNTQAKLILCESEEDLNISPVDLKNKITPNTKAILLTHMNGLPCDYYAILKIVHDCEKKYNIKIKIIGDAARACGSTYNTKKTGYFEWATMFSFQRKKQMTTLGEGGMIVTDDAELYDVVKKYRSFGNAITWGSNYKMTNIQAKVGICQLEKLDTNNTKRIMIAKRRNDYLGTHLDGFVLPNIEKDVCNTFYLYTVLVPENWTCKQRNLLLDVMSNKYRIGCCIANDVTYKTNSYIREKIGKVDLPKSERIGERILTIVIHPELTLEEENYINTSFVNAVQQVKKTSRNVL